MELNKIYEGNCLDVIKTFPDKSIDCVITSPPYWQLRDYKWDGQWGLEPTFQEYLEHLWELMDEVWRVLKDTGTVWINLGDTYNTVSGRMGKNDEYGGSPKFTDGENMATNFKQIKSSEIKNKCLLLIPHRFAIGCIDRGWTVRNDIIWAKRNGMPESVSDRFSKKHEYLFLMAKSDKYFFDLESIRDNPLTNENRPDAVVRNRLYGYDSKSNRMNGVQPQRDYENGVNGHNQQQRGGNNENGKNPGSVSDFWDIPTSPSKEEHYASFNTALIDKPIIAGSPRYVCNKCGKPRENIVEREFEGKYNNKEGETQRIKNAVSGGTEKVTLGKTAGVKNTVIGLTDCGCNAGFSGGIILDPFCGTATTGCRAIDLQRKFIGIEGSPEYVKIGNKKLYPYLITQQLF